MILGGEMTRLTPCDFRGEKLQGLPLVILGGEMTRLTPCDFRGEKQVCDFRAKIDKAYPL